MASERSALNQMSRQASLRGIGMLFPVLLAASLHNLHAEGSQLPRIVEHPVDTAVRRHEPATLNCKAEGLPTPTIQWYKDGVPLKILPGSHRITLPAGGLFFLKVVNARRETDAGIYWCEARNRWGAARSRNATLQVVMLRDEFRREPHNTYVAQGDTALLECAAPRGVPEPTITWKKDGQTLKLEDSKRIRVVDGGNLAIQSAHQSDEGQYQCIAKNPIGTRESTLAILKVHVKPYIIRGPHDQAVLAGSSVIFPCRVGGDPMPDVLWLRTASGGNMPLDRVSVLEDRSLRLERVTIADEGEYSCEADNVVGSITARGTLIVLASPTFLQRPTGRIVELGADASFECRVNGNPPPTVFWTIKNNRTIIFPGAPPIDRFQSINTEQGHSILTLTHFQRTDKGTVVICNAMNEVATITAHAQVNLNALEERPPPIIIAGPLNQTLPVNSVASLQCKALGLPNPSISWYHEGVLLRSSSKANITAAGDLVIYDLRREEDQGVYTCVASSPAGKSTWSGYLRVELPTNPNIKFFRAADESKFPTAPGQPKTLSVATDSLTLNWPASERPGASPLLGYCIEMYATNKSKAWIPIASRLPEPNFTVEGLTTGATYFFIVRAENVHGFSPPSPISEPITAGATKKEMSAMHLIEVETILQNNNIVELVEANATDSTTIMLTWDIDNAKLIEGFYVYARELDSILPKNLTIPNKVATAEESTTSCMVTGLNKASQYEFFLMPYYKDIVGKPSNAKYASTMEDAPEASPFGMEAMQFNRSSVFLKWQPPHPKKGRNGILTSYSVLVKGLDSYNTTRFLRNMTIDAASQTLLLVNLTTGVTYYITVAAATRVGIGPFSKPVVLRIDPRTQSLNTGYTRYPLNLSLADDILTRTWFIVLIGTLIAIIVFSFGALVLFKRHQFLKQTSLGGLHGNHAIGPVQKFSALPLNTNSVWIDPSGGVWRQAMSCTKDPLPNYAEVTAQKSMTPPDYDKLTSPNMPIYAEVGCSTFKNPFSSIDRPPRVEYSTKETSSCTVWSKIVCTDKTPDNNFGPYATTNLVVTTKPYQNSDWATNKAFEPSCTKNYQHPTNDSGFKKSTTTSARRGDSKITLIENKLNLIDSLNPTASLSSNSSTSFSTHTTASTAICSDSNSIDCTYITTRSPLIAQGSPNKIYQQPAAPLLMDCNDYTHSQVLASYGDTHSPKQGESMSLRHQANAQKMFRSENNIHFKDSYSPKHSSGRNMPGTIRTGLRINNAFHTSGESTNYHINNKHASEERLLAQSKDTTQVYKNLRMPFKANLALQPWECSTGLP